MKSKKTKKYLHALYRPYNKTFHCYCEQPMSKKQATMYIKHRNMYKGGFWIIHTEKDYISWRKLHPPVENKEGIEKLEKCLYPFQRKKFADFNKIVKFLDNGIVFNPYFPKNNP